MFEETPNESIPKFIPSLPVYFYHPRVVAASTDTFKPFPSTLSLYSCDYSSKSSAIGIETTAVGYPASSSFLLASTAIPTSDPVAIKVTFASAEAS